MSRPSMLLPASLAGNVIAAAAFGVYVRAVGLEAFLQKIHLRQAPPINYARVAMERFVGLPGSAVVVLGDSLVQEGPFGELIGESARRGIGGARIDDVTGMVPSSVASTVAQVLVIAGTNDALQGRSRAEVKRDAVALVAAIRAAAPDAVVLWMAAPGPVGHAEQTEAVNTGIEAASQVAGFGFFWTVLAERGGTIRPEFTLDGVHINAAGYAALGHDLRRALGLTRD